MNDNAQSTLSEHLLLSYDQLKRRLTRYLGCGELAGDALQDTWLRLQRMSPLSVVKNPHAFLLRMAANVAVDLARSRSRGSSKSEAEALLEAVDPNPGPEQLAETRTEMERMMRTIERLPARRREVLILVRWEGLPQQAVADRLGVSLRTVEYELKRAQDRISACMGTGERRK